ncbi:MAG: hypothetical protein CMB56_003890 [Methanobacteriota archaeon]|nr:MAG: hypothetical protein CMB56_003890 [Euryarchaeota archaeon]|tara:strand:- start:5934 stop:6662 length:729 start_codon:yes stop_codon:yes gene_type:complete
MGDNLITLASRLERRLLEKKATVSAAESCTGGLLTSTLTDISGSSACFNQSWITYSNESKIIELDVKPNTIAEHGAVSAEVAIQMAKGARKKANSDIAIAISGIAGPKTDDTRKKVGEVYVGISSTMYEGVKSKIFSGDRKQNKLNFVTLALRAAIEIWDRYHINDFENIENIDEQEIQEFEEKLEIKSDSEVYDKNKEWDDDEIGENWIEDLDEEETIQIIEKDVNQNHKGIDDINWSEQE